MSLVTLNKRIAALIESGTEADEDQEIQEISAADSLQVGSFNEERFEEVEAQEDERLVLRFRITNSRVTDIVSSSSLIN